MWADQVALACLLSWFFQLSLAIKQAWAGWADDRLPKTATKSFMRFPCFSFSPVPSYVLLLLLHSFHLTLAYSVAWGPKTQQGGFYSSVSITLHSFHSLAWPGWQISSASVSRLFQGCFNALKHPNEVSSNRILYIQWLIRVYSSIFLMQHVGEHSPTSGQFLISCSPPLSWSPHQWHLYMLIAPLYTILKIIYQLVSHPYHPGPLFPTWILYTPPPFTVLSNHHIIAPPCHCTFVSTQSRVTTCSHCCTLQLLHSCHCTLVLLHSGIATLSYCDFSCCVSLHYHTLVSSSHCHILVFLHPSVIVPLCFHSLPSSHSHIAVPSYIRLIPLLSFGDVGSSYSYSHIKPIWFGTCFHDVCHKSLSSPSILLHLVSPPGTCTACWSGMFLNSVPTLTQLCCYIFAVVGWMVCW